MAFDSALISLAIKKAAPDVNSTYVDMIIGVAYWILHHLSTVDSLLKVGLTGILLLSAIVRLGMALVKFYRTLKDKGVNGD